MKTKVNGIAFGLIYSESLDDSLAFYTKYFGFEEKLRMDEGHSVWGKAGEMGLWIGSGYKKLEHSEQDTRVNFMISVESASQLFSGLKADGIKLIHTEPMDMGENQFWFQFVDPSGNIMEILGGK
jgi:predicted enzyme related to lactoylglutathione lyase